MKRKTPSSSESSSDSSDDDDQMRSRLLASCVSAEMIKTAEAKIDKVKTEIVKVGPYKG